MFAKQMKRSGAMAIGIAAMAAVAVAGGVPTARAADVPAPGKAQLSPAQIVQKVEAASYTNIHDVEFDDGRWELEATSPKGAAVDLKVDAATGEILGEEAD